MVFIFSILIVATFLGVIAFFLTEWYKKSTKEVQENKKNEVFLEESGKKIE